MFLPTDLVGDYHLMLWSTDGWPTLANGSSGFDPPWQAQLRKAVKTFPDAGSVAALRARGVRTVVLVRSRAAGSEWEGAADKPVTGLGIRAARPRRRRRLPAGLTERTGSCRSCLS